MRPSQIFRVAVSILSSPITLSVRASILRNGVDIGSATQECKPGIPETLLIKIPSTTVPGQYRLRVEGNTDRALGGTAFLNETLLNFSQRSMTIFIQTEKPVYHQSQIGSFAFLSLIFSFPFQTNKVLLLLFSEIPHDSDQHRTASFRRCSGCLHDRPPRLCRPSLAVETGACLYYLATSITCISYFFVSSLETIREEATAAAVVYIQL